MQKEKTMKYFGKLNDTIRKREAKFIEKYTQGGPIEHMRRDGSVVDLITKL